MGLIRLLLAIAVCHSHYPIVDIPLVDGHEAVLAFFAISGFYMALVLDKAYGTAREFYLSRFASLYPMYVFALTLAVALLVVWDVHPMTTLERMQTLLTDTASFLTIAWTSLCIVGQELLFCLAPAPGGGLHFDGASRTAIYVSAPLIQAWSLSLEIVFYALAPWLVRLKTRLLAQIIAASLGFKIAVLYSPWADIVFFKRFFLSEFWLFGCGVLAYRVFKRLGRTPRSMDYAAFLSLVLAVCLADLVPEKAEPFALPGIILLTMPFIFRGFRAFSFDRIIGRISYPFYLLHFSFIALFETLNEEPTGWDILFTTLAAAMLTHCLFGPGLDAFKARLRTGHAVSMLVPAQFSIVPTIDSSKDI